MVALKRGMGLQKALDAATEIFGNPIIMFDISYNLLAHTENTVTDDPLWNELITLGKFSHETVDFFYTEGFIEEYAKSDVVTYLISDKLKYDRVNAKIFDNDGIQIADIISVACYKNLTEQDFALYESISEVISAELRDSDIYQNIKRGFPASPLDDLLEENFVDSADTEKAVRNLCSGLKANLYVAVVDVVNYDPTLTHLVYFMELFNDMQQEYKYFVYLNNIVILISTDNPTLIVKKDLMKLSRFFEKFNIYAGISDCFQNIHGLQKHYKHAINALNYGMNSKNMRHIFKYDDFRLDRFLGSLTGDYDLSGLHNPIVPLIKKYDNDRGTAYMDTIHAYLLAGGDAMAASDILKVTHEELRAQLKDIEEIFGLDWNDGNMLYSVFTSIKLLEIPLP